MNIEQVHSCSWSIVIPKSVVPALQNYIHMYASSNISISRTTLYLGPVMYVWKCVQCRLWPQKENQSIWWFCLDWVRCIIFGKKPQTHLSYLIMCLLMGFLDIKSIILYVSLKFYIFSSFSWIKDDIGVSGVVGSAVFNITLVGFCFLPSLNFSTLFPLFWKYVTIMASYFARLMFNSVKQCWRPLFSLTGDNLQIYCVSTAQVIAVCALFATHAIVLNWYSVCRWLINL